MTVWITCPECKGDSLMVTRKANCPRCHNVGSVKVQNGADAISLTTGQPPPSQAAGPDVWQLVLKDMEDRRAMGIRKYGMPVRPFNGRNALIDIEEELLDGIVYCRQFREEMKCLGRELQEVLALLAGRQSLDKAAIAKIADLLTAILQRSLALVAE